MSDAQRVEELMARKYRLDRIFVLPIYRVVMRLRGRAQGSDSVFLAITPGESP